MIVYTKTVDRLDRLDSLFRALWLATRDIQCYSSPIDAAKRKMAVCFRNKQRNFTNTEAAVPGNTKKKTKVVLKNLFKKRFEKTVGRQTTTANENSFANPLSVFPNIMVNGRFRFLIIEIHLEDGFFKVEIRVYIFCKWISTSLSKMWVSWVSTE